MRNLLGASQIVQSEHGSPAGGSLVYLRFSGLDHDLCLFSVRQVLDTSRNYNDLLNVLAALQNILDPSHFKGSMGPMKKVAERLTACGFEDTIFSFVHGIKKRYNEIL